ncbi:aminoglycoside adenylyltransferase domain-containing protein [Sporolactobacillus pectinivorans]|uniref:aminoglycoside adenylyltransferase domain-containing protein n=1 Tax=Sporolactobacillus pectinivorans TaxID=1591408 RepID=UPI000C2617AA|nr:aminoglycoside adenylyltransferase domain-containing protein [Sporolactobacillus pectinivorans]
MKTIEIFNTIKNDYQTILGENLTGIYIHGSYAFGCFNERKSDLDFIVVVHSKLDAETKLALLVLGNLHDTASSKGLEMSVVLKKYCAHFQYPTPYELHFSNMWWAAYLSDPMKLCTDDLKTDRDFAGHFTVINHCGTVLYGEPIQSVFGEVKSEYYIRSIVNDIEDASSDIDEQPTYVILNLCRVLAYLTDKKIVSKQQGGE